MSHIVLVIASLNPGGAEHVLSNLANYWVSQGYDVSLITFSAVNYAPFYYLDSRVNLIQLGQSSSAASLFSQKWRLLKRLFLLRKTIKKNRPDVIISFIDMMNVIVLAVTRRLKIPVIVSERIDPTHHPVSMFRQWLRLKLYPLAACLVVQTERVARYFPKHFKQFIKIIPNSVVMPDIQRDEAFKDIRHIVSVGRLAYQKGYDTLIHALSTIIKFYPDIILTIYGEGPERKNLECLIESLDLKNHVYLPGTTKDIQMVLRRADLFIFPSRYEGFPNALCEAMAMGLPVIASDCSGNVDVVRDGIDGKLFPVNDIALLANITLELLRNPYECTRLAYHAKEVCDRFHPDCIFSLWDDVISNVIKR